MLPAAFRSYRFPTAVLAVAVLLVATVVPTAIAAAFAQGDQPAPQETNTFEGQVDVTEVLLDVLVTDKEGRVIVGLGPDDFTVLEDGEPMEITDVTFYSNSVFMETMDEARTKGLEVDRVPVDRYFILFFHDQRLETAPIVQASRQQLDAARKTQRWVREEVLPTDWVAVVSYDQKLNIHQDFTHDKAAILDALEDAPVARDRQGNWPSRIEETDGPSLRAHLPTGKKLGKETRTIYEGLQVLAEAAGHVVGRKNLVFFSRGFGDINSFGIYQPDPRYYDDTEQALNENNVAVYAIDTTPPEVSHTLENALNQISVETGGEYYFNFNNFINPLRQVADENTGYYLLSYRTTHPADESGYQEVEVTVDNPALKVKAREGYLYGQDGGAEAAAAPKTRQSE